MKEEKRKILYLDPKIKIVTFETGDVIATSGGGGFDFGASQGGGFNWGSGGGDTDDAWT